MKRGGSLLGALIGLFVSMTASAQNSTLLAYVGTGIKDPVI